MNRVILTDDGNDDDFGEEEYNFGAEPKSPAAVVQQEKIRAQATAHWVRVDDDLVEAFPTTASVNEALREVLQQRQSDQTTKP